jgi:hypothetical protein
MSDLEKLVRKARGDVAPAELEALRKSLEPAVGSLPDPRPLPVPPATPFPILPVAGSIVLVTVTGIAIFAVLQAEPSAPEPSPPPAIEERAPPPEPPPPEPAPAVEASPAPVERRAEPAPDPAAELVLVQRARGELRSGDASSALRTAREHQRLFPRGRLAEERERIAIEALSSLGRADPARARAERFLRRYPQSVHRDRIESLVGR